MVLFTTGDLENAVTDFKTSYFSSHLSYVLILVLYVLISVLYVLTLVSYVLILMAFECMRVVERHGFGVMRLAICFPLKLGKVPLSCSCRYWAVEGWKFPWLGCPLPLAACLVFGFESRQLRTSQATEMAEAGRL
jgi:hypothetical protein